MDSQEAGRCLSQGTDSGRGNKPDSGRKWRRGRRLSQGGCTVLMDDFGQVYGFGQRPAAAVGW